MFLSKKDVVDCAGDTVERVASEAETLFRSGKMHCAEAVLAAVKNSFAPELPPEVVGVAAGFGGGSYAGCLCGAVSGGTMAFGLLVKQDKKKVAVMTGSLHQWFKEEYLVTCCKVLSAHGKSGCPKITARVAAKVTQLVLAQGQPTVQPKA